MMTRREAIGLLGSMSVGTVLGTTPRGFSSVIWPTSGLFPRQSEPAPPLAPGAPTSAERLALIEAFKRDAAGLDDQFEARTHKSDWVMPYRLFRPKASGPLPLVVFLHGSGGQGTDNVRQMGLGNIFRHARLGAAGESEELPVLRRRPADGSRLGQLRPARAGRFGRARHSWARRWCKAGIRDCE